MAIFLTILNSQIDRNVDISIETLLMQVCGHLKNNLQRGFKHQTIQNWTFLSGFRSTLRK